MRVLLVGGTGLISSAIAESLLSRGDDLVIFNRGLAAPRPLGGIRQIIGDRYDAPSFIRSVRGAGPFDCIIDMIGYEPHDAASLVEAAQGTTGHLIFCSTVDVYAKPASVYPITESEPRRPVNAYGRGKAVSEDVLMAAAAKDFAVTILRPAHTYGPGGRHRGNFVHAFGSSTTFLDRLRRGKPVIVPGDGSALRGSTHIRDVSATFVNATNTVPAELRVCHVTSEEWLTWNRYHQILAQALGGPEPELIHIPTALLARIAPKRAVRCPENYQFNGVYDNTAAHRELDFRYRTCFADGARETLAWVRRNGGFEDSDTDPFYDAVIAAWRTAADGLEADLREREQ